MFNGMHKAVQRCGSAGGIGFGAARASDQGVPGVRRDRRKTITAAVRRSVKRVKTF